MSSGFYKHIFGMKSNILIKLHEEEDRKYTHSYDYVFLPIRDPRDSVISLMHRLGKKKDIEEVLELMEKNIDRYNRYASIDDELPHNFILVKYEEYDFDTLKNIANIFPYIDEEVLLRIYEAVDNMLNLDLPDDMNMKNNKVTLDSPMLLCRGHNTSGGKSRKYLDYFTKEENDRIISVPVINSFLIKYNYPLNPYDTHT